MSQDRLHGEWLSLIEISGPFLAVPVLKEVFPQGLEELDGIKRKRLRQAYEEWREAWETDDPKFPDLHRAWVAEVLDRGLELDEDGRGDVLKRGDALPEKLRVESPEHGVVLTPDAAVIDEQTGNTLLLIDTYPAEVDLEAVSKSDGWASSPAERMVQLCRGTGCRLGLITNGERWMLVDAPLGAVTTFASWYARLWGQEPVTLQAFVHLLGVRRFFFDVSEQLPALLDRSLKYQDEVTDALGEQVRRAVEVLIQALDKADIDRDRQLLEGVPPAELYEAALTVMMRLVFLLSAEERGLLLLGDERYEAYYALSTLRMQLRAESPEILERRWDAWSRLLALFRAVYGGIEHENLRMPALGGSLFDPDRFPFLEGRAKGTNWRCDAAKPLPIDNRTVILLLEAIQQFQGRSLSYRALDVEQIGYVYEGLLERTVKRTSEVTLELDATKNAKNPWITLGELESARLDDNDRLEALLRERSGSSASRIRNDLAEPVHDVLADRLLTACHADRALRDRILPYAHLLRTDPWYYPLVYPKGAFIVTTGSDRRETGTHYTPKSLTEAIVAETLTPVAYVGPVDGKPREEWVLKSPAELLDLKICDPAMGSGAFLVQVCRWLAERLVEAWGQEEAAGRFVTADGEVSAEAAEKEPLPRDAEARTVTARRLIAERCLYGVDLNPLAVELAKLSIWLVTLAKGRPFGFLDHNLRCGDSLLGIHRLDQLTELSMTPGGKRQQRLFGRNIEQAVQEAIELRKRLREMPIRDIHDVEAMARLDAEARQRLDAPERVADALIGEVFRWGANTDGLEDALVPLTIEAERYLEGDSAFGDALIKKASKALSIDLPIEKSVRRPFHWPLEFPEVFGREQGGFDAVVGNPPFLGGKRITGVMGTAYRDWLVGVIAADRRGSADLVAYFFLRGYTLLRDGGGFGLLAVNTIAEGDTRQVGLEAMVSGGASIHAAWPNEAWPGKAAVVTSRVHIHKGNWDGERLLSGQSAPHISAFLSDQDEWSPKQLRANAEKAFIGSVVNGMGFVLSDDEAKEMIDADPKNAEVIFPYLNGEDLNSHPEQKPSRWVINFWDWPEEKAASYSLPFRRVLELVKPVRDRKKRAKYRERWWHYSEAVPNLYHAIGRHHSYIKHPAGWKNTKALPDETVLLITRVSKTVAFARVSNTSTFSDATVVISMSDPHLFSVLQSSFHVAFAWQYASKLKNDLRYSPSDAFDPFPFPGSSTVLATLGDRYHDHRAALMRECRIGLTKIYNRFHDATDNNSGIADFRDLHCQIDEAVKAAYGWHDLNLDHGFHAVPYLPENDRVRFTVSEPARQEILRRLAALNKERYAAEVAAGLHEKQAAKAKQARGKSPVKERKIDQSIQTGLFEERPETALSAAMAGSKTKLGNMWGTTAVDQILAWLEAHKGWYPKTAILNGCGALLEDWDSAIGELIADDFVESRGENDTLTYRAKT